MQVSAWLLWRATRRKSLLIPFLLFLFTFSAFSMAVRLKVPLSGWWAKHSLTTQASAQEPLRISVLHFTLTPLGLNPTAMTVPEGWYVIEVTNRSEFNEFSLNLGSLANHKIKAVDAIKKHGEWRGVFDLKRDDFLLSIAEKPAWAASIQVIKEK